MSNPSETGHLTLQSHSRSRAARRGRIATALATFAAVAMLALPALAGTVQIKDTADALTSEQEAALQKTGGQYPFDVRVLTTDNATNKNAFDKYVGEQVSEPNMVVVAVDPSHHRTSVHFGTGTRIGAGEYKAIEDAGDSHFRDKDFAGGISAILDRATQAVGSGPVLDNGTHTSAVPQANRTSGGSGIGTWIVVLGVGFIVVMVLMALARRRNGGQPAGYNQGPYVGGPPQGGGYGQPYYGPQQGNYGGGGSGLGGNLMSAGLGGLVGYEIGKATSEHHNSNDGGGYSGGYGGDSGGSNNDTSSYDAGGSTSDWGGGGGDSGGGGFDGGGGGSDGGGGGGDW